VASWSLGSEVAVHSLGRIAIVSRTGITLGLLTVTLEYGSIPISGLDMSELDFYKSQLRFHTGSFLQRKSTLPNQKTCAPSRGVHVKVAHAALRLFHVPAKCEPKAVRHIGRCSLRALSFTSLAVLAALLAARVSVS
jgi:hypothetical protein